MQAIQNCVSALWTATVIFVASVGSAGYIGSTIQEAYDGAQFRKMTVRSPIVHIGTRTGNDAGFLTLGV